MRLSYTAFRALLAAPVFIAGAVHAAEPADSPNWTVTKHGACCESNLASEGGTTHVLAPILVNGNDIIRSNDGGQNWTKVYPPVDVSVPFGIEGDLQAINDDVIYFGTELAVGVVAFSRDRGDTWTTVQLPVPFAANDQSWSYLGPMTDVPGCNGLQTADYVLAGWFRIGSVAVFSCDGGVTWPIQTPLVGNNGNGPIHIVCQSEAVAPNNGGDTRIANPEFVRMKAGRHGNFGPDKNFYWAELTSSTLYVCRTADFGVNWTGTAHPLPQGNPGGTTVALLAFDDNGTQYVMQANRLNVSFDSGTSFVYSHLLPRWGMADTGDGGSAEFFVVENGNMHLAVSVPIAGNANRIYYLYGKGVDTATPTWTEELVDTVPADAGSLTRLDFMQLTVDDNGIPTIGYTTPDGGTTTASRLVAPAGDPDGDGIETILDNCPATANSDQANSDGDSIGDACDNCTLIDNESQCNTNAGTGAGEDLYGNHCDADLDNNGIVNSFDLKILRDNMGAAGANDADLDCNSIVNSFDVSTMRGDFGEAPGPSGLVAP